MNAFTSAITRWWWVWTLLAGLATVACLLGAGLQLARANLGLELRARACSASPLAAVALVFAAGVGSALTGTFARCRSVAARLTWDPGTLPYTTLVPTLAMLASLPGVLGCRSASSIARIDIVGDALVGVSGLALCAASTLALGAVVGRCCCADIGGTHAADVNEVPSIVELAIADAEAFRAQGSGSRFHGVNSDD